MFVYKRKRDWIAGILGEKIPRHEKVTLWVLSNGALCELGYLENVPFLRNGKYNGLGARFAELLLSAGISGRVIINNETQIPQGVPNWLTWWLSQVDYEKQLTLYSLKITTFGQQPKIALPFQVETILPMEVEAGAVLSLISAKSRSAAVGQFIIERKNGEVYRLEPHRTITARVLDVTQHGFVMRSQQGVVFATHQVHRSFKADLERRNLKPEDLIGTDVTVQYTMCTEGPRLNNYKSASVARAAAFEDAEENVYVDRFAGDDEPLFQAPAWAQCSGMLKLQHCIHAMITINQEKTTITAYDTTDTSRVLFSLVKGAEPGLYVACLANSNGQLEEWVFQPSATADTLNPESFIASMESVLYYATGYSIRGLGLCYTDRMRQLESA